MTTLITKEEIVHNPDTHLPITGECTVTQLNSHVDYYTDLVLFDRVPPEMHNKLLEAIDLLNDVAAYLYRESSQK